MALLLALLAAAGFGQSPDRNELNGIFSAMDQNRDGYVTEAEAPQVRSVRSSTGHVAVRLVGSWIERHDRDGDNRVSRREFVDRAETELASYRR